MAEPLRHTTDATPSLRQVIAGEVLALMGRNRVSQTALAAKLGMKQPSLSARLNCETPWKIDEIEAIAAYFGVPISSLISCWFYDAHPLTSADEVLGQMVLALDTAKPALSIVAPLAPRPAKKALALVPT